ncbi:MAG: hypothetical protein HY717_19295, partial [Planctomycetes bacterium]|nr:hypothetical protein [Planctomycetota bacterium]
VKEAIEKGRKIPRPDSYGLPNLKVKIWLELSAEEDDLLRKAMDQVAGEMGQSLGGSRIGLKDSLLLDYFSQVTSRNFGI